MSAQKYTVTRESDLVVEFKSGALKLNGTLRGLEEKAKRCESFKYQNKETSNLVARKGDWEIYLQDAKRKLQSVLPKLKDIQRQGKQRKKSFIGSVKGVLPSWAKKKIRGKYLQISQVIKDSEDCEVLIDDILRQINSVHELSSMANRISQEGENEQIASELHHITSRWNALNESVVSNCNSLETLVYQVDREYRNLAQWHDSCDAVNSWLDISEQHLKEDKSETTISGVKEKLRRNQERIKEVKRHRLQVENVNRSAEDLLNSGRLDETDAERLQRFNDTLCRRYQELTDQLATRQNTLYANIHQLQKEPGQKEPASVVEVAVQPNLKPVNKILSPFGKDSDDKGNNNENKTHESMKEVKAILAQFDASTDKEKERIQEKTVKVFETSLKTVEKSLNDLDDESLQSFSAVGATTTEVRQQLDEIQAFEEKLVDEDEGFGLIKDTFDEAEKKKVMQEDESHNLRKKIDELDSTWEEMWRSHNTNKERLVQAILVMGGEWMGTINKNLDDLEDDIDEIEIPQNDLQALRVEEQKQKKIMTRIGSYEDAVRSAVDVAREVHRRDLVDSETAKTIENETQSLEERLERLKEEAQEKKRRISEAVAKTEKETFVNEFLVCSSAVSTVQSEPDTLQTDEGFVEPEHKDNGKKQTYAFLINEKKNEFQAGKNAVTEWLNQTNKLVTSLRPGMESGKALKIQRKINARHEELKEKQALVDRVNRLSREIENETLDPSESEPFVRDAETLSDRWSKSKEMLNSCADKNVERNTDDSNCCFVFMRKKLFHTWAYS